MAPLISTFVFLLQEAIRITNNPSNTIFLIICRNDINNVHLILRSSKVMLFFYFSQDVMKFRLQKTVNLLLMGYFGVLMFEIKTIFANNETSKIRYYGSFVVVYLFVGYDRGECK